MNMEKYNSLDDVRKRIDSNYYFIKALEKEIDACRDDDEKLAYITFIGYLYSEYVTGIYSSNMLENEIIKIGRKIKFVPTVKPHKRKMLHVMTKAYNAGGHTTVVRNWIQWDKDRQYSMVLTDMKQEEVPSNVLEAVSASQGKLICLEGNYTEKAKQLLEISQDFERIILHIHMYDVVPILAYSNCNWKIPVYFYNHADFRFSYGYSIADAVLNLNQFDLEKSREYRGVSDDKNLILRSPNGGFTDSIVMDENIANDLISKYRIDKNAKLIVSMGQEFKYEDIIDYSFTEFVYKLMNKSSANIQFIIIGPDPKRKKWKELEDRTNGHARAIGYIDRKEVYGLIKMCNLFICSFPMRSSGAGLAERWGVPYLSLFVIDREIEFFGENKVETIDELIEKSLDVINGNIAKYKGHCLENSLTRKEWCDKWNKIIEKYPFHGITEFKENRYIKKQEFVNCQLMQETATENIARYLNIYGINKQWQEPLQERFFYLDNKYGMNIFYKLEVLKEDISRYYSDKHLQLYLLAIKWIQIKQAGKKIEDYLLDKGYSAIAIYGMSYMGTALLNEINRNKLEVKYGIDRKADKIMPGIRVYFPKDELPQVDVIINTTTLENELIRKELKNKDIKLLSFAQVIEELLEG